MSARAYPLPRKVGVISARSLVDVLSTARCNLSHETKTQADLYDHLCANLPAEAVAAIQREVRLSAKDRVDVWVDGVVIEVKLDGSPFRILDQLVRYAKHDAVEAIILATNKAMCLPKQIEGKPAFTVSLGRAWL